jgi:hypothetical protein
MSLEAYTANNICISMGLSGFAEESLLSGKYGILRTLLTPSFHPEICITIQENDTTAAVSVTSLKEKFWGQSMARGVVLPHFTEDSSLSNDQFNALAASFADAFSASKLERKRNVIHFDGIGVESLLYKNGSAERFKESATYHPSIHLFTINLIQTAWESCKNPILKNALARAAIYVDLKLPKLDEPPQPSVMNILVLGSKEERQEYLDALQAKKPKPPMGVNHPSNS